MNSKSDMKAITNNGWRNATATGVSIGKLGWTKHAMQRGPIRSELTAYGTVACIQKGSPILEFPQRRRLAVQEVRVHLETLPM